ncbi:YphA family membrane protein [Peribacillus sp. NPDC097675]|uniref:YphA family membrane protein n=1 Tax=Peribacillus sp. NPDC097675 TaxID=3390618 RepID=UPI003D04D34C
MDGVFFYWVSWLVWISIMFFIPNTVAYRFDYLFHLLATMVLVGYTLEISPLTIHLSGIYLFFILCIYMRKLSLMKTIEVVIGSLIIALAYASFQLFSLLDPIWLILKAPYLLCILLNYVILMLFKDWKRRMSVLLIGMILGDIVYTSLLQFHSFNYVALSYAWHDQAVLVLAANALWRALELLSGYFLSQTRFLSKERKEHYTQ